MIFAADTQDGRLFKDDPTWAGARDAASADGSTFASGRGWIEASLAAGPVYNMWRSTLLFPTSAIGLTDDVVAGTVSLSAIGDQGAADDGRAVLVPGSYPLPSSDADWDALTFTANSDKPSIPFNPGPMVFTLNAAGLANVAKGPGAVTKYWAIMELDRANTPPTVGSNLCTFDSADGTTPPSMDLTIAAPTGDGGLVAGRRQGRR